MPSSDRPCAMLERFIPMSVGAHNLPARSPSAYTLGSAAWVNCAGAQGADARDPVLGAWNKSRRAQTLRRFCAPTRAPLLRTSLGAMDLLISCQSRPNHQCTSAEQSTAISIPSQLSVPVQVSWAMFPRLPRSLVNDSSQRNEEHRRGPGKEHIQPWRSLPLSPLREMWPDTAQAEATQGRGYRTLGQGGSRARRDATRLPSAFLSRHRKCRVSGPAMAVHPLVHQRLLAQLAVL